MSRQHTIHDWPSLRAALIQYCHAQRGSAAELATFLAVDRRELSRWLTPTGPEPRYSIGKKMESWLDTVLS